MNPADFEKLGLFYLGRELDASTKARTDAPLLYDSSDLVTHGVIAGMTGSGKTGLGIGLIEEAAIDGVPVIAIDPKGDLGNLLLTFPALAPADFAPWVDADEARRAGQAPDAFAGAEAAKWSKGLAEWGQDGARIQRLRDAAELALYTPGSTSGRPLSIMKSFAGPAPALLDDADLLQDRVSTAATCVLTLAGVDAEPMRSREHTLLAALFSESWRAGRDLDLATLITQIQAPPIQKIGVVDIESFFPSKERFGLAMQLNQLLAAPGFAAWLEGEPLDVSRLLYTDSGRPRTSIISIAHLDDQERMFFVSLLLNEIVGWMRSQRGTSSLRALIYFDEIFGFLPPVANPPSKAPLLTILKQARAFGMGLVVATQNPVDLDYKALANAGTWMLGRLQTERDKARVLDGLEGAAAGAPLDRSHIDTLLSGLGKRQFLLHNVHEKEPVVFETRWTLSYLRGPLGRDEIKKLTATGDQARPTPQRSSPVRDLAPAVAAPPVVDPAITQLFVPSATAYAPMLLGVAKVSYSDAKLGLDEPKAIAVVTAITDGAVAVDWERAEIADFSIDGLLRTPPAGASFTDVPPPAARTKSYSTWEKDFSQWVGQSQSVELFKSRRAKLVSHPDESERDFRIRLQGEAREARDAAIAKVRDKYATKLTTMQDRNRRAEQAVQVQAEQATSATMGAAWSAGAAIF
ncbi:MAG: ATP-binding protein, partial [Acidimicrobiia bacterium]